MTPIAFLQSLLKVNRPGAAFIMTGLGVLAAAALAVSWLGDAQNAITLALYTLIFAAAASVLSFVVTNRRMKTVLGWMFISGFGLMMFAAVDSVIQITGRVPFPVCMRSILDEPPQQCMARFAAATPALTVATAAPVPPQPGVSGPTALTPGEGQGQGAPLIVTRQAPDAALSPPRIALQFVAPMTRDTASRIATTLETADWQIDGGATGGEEVPNWPGATQVRFYDAAYQDQAALLAQDLSQALGGAPVEVRDFSTYGLLVAKNRLEIWIASAPLS